MKHSTERPYLWLFGLLALIGLTADQASKYGIFSYLYSEDLRRAEAPNIPIIPGAFRLEAAYIHVGEGGRRELHHETDGGTLAFLRTISGPCLPRVNRGALFGIGNGDSDAGGMNYVFAFVSVAAAAFIIFWARRPSVAQDRLLCVALGLILGGTLGNLYDRIVFSGVRDFLHWYFAYDWPVFNIADCCLVCGAGVLLVHSIFVHEPPTDAAKTEAIGEQSVPLQTTSSANPM